MSCSADGLVKIWSHKGTEITSLHKHTQPANACDILVKTSTREDDFLLDDDALPPAVESDWGTLVETEDWESSHEKMKVNRKPVSIDDVIVGSCSDDGTVNVWRPLLVLFIR